VSIVVGSAEVFDEIYHALADVAAGNLADLGVRLGMLLAQLRASGCETPACIVLDGLLSALRIEAHDYTPCVADLDAAWPQFEAAITEIEGGHLQQAALATGTALVTLAHATSACGVEDLFEVLNTTASRLGKTGVARAIGQAVQVLTEGSDLTLDLAQLLTDGKAANWPSFGHDLGNLAAWLSSTGCTSFVCTLLEGLLDGAAIPFQSLTACMSDLSSSEAAFVAGAAAFANRSYAAALTDWAAALHDVATSVSDCHLADELTYVANEAQVLGFGQVALLDEVAQVLVHGANFYDDLYAAVQDIESHDYRSAGTEMGKVMTQLSEWTAGHACTSDFCYVVLGIFQFLGDIQGDIRACESDFSLAFHNFSAAVTVMTSSSVASHGGFPFNTNTDALKQGIRDLGYGLGDVANGVSDCHLAQLADVIAQLATKLGVAPEIQWVEEVLHILIDGVEIEREISNACIDYADGNWVGFGYNIAKLVQSLVSDWRVTLEQPALAK